MGVLPDDWELLRKKKGRKGRMGIFSHRLRGGVPRTLLLPTVFKRFGWGGNGGSKEKKRQLLTTTVHEAAHCSYIYYDIGGKSKEDEEKEGGKHRLHGSTGKRDGRSSATFPRAIRKVSVRERMREKKKRRESHHV